MLRLFRVRACCLVTALALAAGTAGASLDLLLHADAAHADACVPMNVGHDASAHRIQAAGSSDTHATHCVACHWARSLRLRAESAAPAHRPDESGPRRVAQTIGVVSAPALAHLPPRSPPQFA
jgi:hypothetical protein